LLAQRSRPPTTLPKLSAEAIERRVKSIKQRLAEGGDVARATLRELFPNAITLEPDDSGAHLWAVFLDDEVSRISLL
jgi:DNA-binding transcriptional MocR family regulator